MTSSVAATPKNQGEKTQTEPTVAMLQQNPKLMHSAPAPGHPLAGYLDVPGARENALIKGKSLSIAQLLENVQNPGTRRVLLQSYWELTGKLAEFHCRLQAEQQAGGASAPRDMKAAGTLNLLRQQRRAAEIEFVKQQWQFAELLRRAKGDAPVVAEENLPIPMDYPLFKAYETHADKIARTTRSRHVGRMIPIQEQLVQSRLEACRDTFELHGSIPASSQELLSMLNQRTEAFLNLIEAIVDYNKMIAEYTSETIPPGISQYRLVGALIELPKISTLAETNTGTTTTFAPLFSPMRTSPLASPQVSPQPSPAETAPSLARIPSADGLADDSSSALGDIMMTPHQPTVAYAPQPAAVTPASVTDSATTNAATENGIDGIQQVSHLEERQTEQPPEHNANPLPPRPMTGQ